MEHGKYGKHGAWRIEHKNMILVIILAINPTLAIHDQHPRPAMRHPIQISHKISHTYTII